MSQWLVGFIHKQSMKKTLNLLGGYVARFGNDPSADDMMEAIDATLEGALSPAELNKYLDTMMAKALQISEELCGMPTKKALDMRLFCNHFYQLLKQRKVCQELNISLALGRSLYENRQQPQNRELYTRYSAAERAIDSQHRRDCARLMQENKDKLRKLTSYCKRRKQVLLESDRIPGSAKDTIVKAMINTLNVMICTLTSLDLTISEKLENFKTKFKDFFALSKKNNDEADIVLIRNVDNVLSNRRGFFAEKSQNAVVEARSIPAPAA